MGLASGSKAPAMPDTPPPTAASTPPSGAGRAWRRWTLLFRAGAGLLLLGGIVALGLLFQGSAWRIPAHALRTASDWNEIQEPAPVSEITPEDLAPANLVIQTNDTDYTVSLDQYESDAYDPGGFRLVRGRAGSPIRIADGLEVRLSRVSVAYGEFPPGKLDEWSVRVPRRFFAVDERGQATEVPPEGKPGSWNNEDRFNGHWPNYDFFIEYPEDAEVKLLSARLYDAASQAKIANGYSLSAGGRPRGDGAPVGRLRDPVDPVVGHARQHCAADGQPSGRDGRVPHVPARGPARSRR